MKDGNGLSTFSVGIKGPCDLRKLVQCLFYPPKKDPREKHKYYDTVDGTYNGYDDDASTILPGVIVTWFMNNIDSLDLEEDEGSVAINTSNDMEAEDNEMTPN